MRTYSQGRTPPQQQGSSSLARSNAATPGPHPGLPGPASPRFGHDFSRIPTHSPSIEPHVSAHRSGRLLPFLDTIQRSFGRHDISHVRAHTDGGAVAEARGMGAEAFARGSDVTFSRPPSLRTAAHEAAHVIQQRAGVQVSGGVGQEGDPYERHADEVAERVARGQSSEALLDAPPGEGGPRPDSRPPVFQMRRIPPSVRALLVSGGVDGPNFTANADGAQRLIDRAMAELSAADQATVLTNRRGALTEAAFNALPRRERLSKHAEAIIALFPARKLGDPTLLDVHPRPATTDDANIAKLQVHANAIFDDIATGARDAWLTQVFG